MVLLGCTGITEYTLSEFIRDDDRGGDDDDDDYDNDDDDGDDDDWRLKTQ